MENQESNFDPAESLRIIRETIDVAKASVQENGFHFLLWGWLIVIGGSGHYLLTDVYKYPDAHFIWLIVSALGGVIAMVYEWRRDRKQPQANVVRTWYGMVWLGFVISLVFAVAWSVANELSPTPIIMALAGFAVFMSGTLLRFKPLIFGAVVFWAGAFACLFLKGTQDSLALALASALGYLVPGYLLSQKAH